MRHVLGIRDAEHEETAPEAETLVVSKLACSLAGQTQTVNLVPGTLAHRAYGRDVSDEQFRCRYGLNPAYTKQIESGALRVSGTDETGKVRIVELAGHRFFLATLFVPQLSSSPAAPHPLIVAYLAAALAWNQARR